MMWKRKRVVIPYLRLNTAANKLDSNEQLIFLSLQNQKDFVNLKTGRFDNINSAVIISSVCKAVQNCKN